MTSPRFLSPKAMHTPVANHLWVNKQPYVDPTNANPTSSLQKVHPLTKDADERRGTTKHIPQRT